MTFIHAHWLLESGGERSTKSNAPLPPPLLPPLPSLLSAVAAASGAACSTGPRCESAQGLFSPRRVLCVSAAAAQEKADASRLLLLLLLLLDTPSPLFPETAIAKFPVRARVSVRAFSTSGTSRQVLRPLKTEVNVEKK